MNTSLYIGLLKQKSKQKQDPKSRKILYNALELVKIAQIKILHSRLLLRKLFSKLRTFKSKN